MSRPRLPASPPKSLEVAPEVAGDAPPPVWSLFSPAQRWTYLFILFLVSTSNYADRNVLSVLLEPIKAEFKVSDTMLGLLSGFSFALVYAVLGIPVARLADRGNRRTVITAALVVWSAATALCGLVQNFWQLALARFGVGAGEAGAIPPAQSLIADYFPPEQRAGALSLFIASATFGYLAGFIIAPQINAAWGWRAAFVAMGLPGLLIAVLTVTVLKEPRLRPAYAITKIGSESIMATFRALATKPAFVNLTIGMTLYFFYAYGAAVFFPSYMVRVLGVDLKTVGTSFGAVSALSSVIGTIGGGFFANRLVKRDIRWTAWLPAIGLALLTPIIELTFLVDFKTYLIVSFVTGCILGASLPPIFAAIHMVCGSARRAMAIAIIFFFANLIGLGIGPLVTGALSDIFTATHGAVGLRYALMLVSLVTLPTSWFFWRAGKTLLADSEG